MKLHILVPFLLTTLVTAVAPSGEVNNRVVDVDTEPSSEIHTVTQLTFKDAATPSNEAYNGVTADADGKYLLYHILVTHHLPFAIVIHTLNLAARDVLDTATRCTAVRECHDREVCERGRCLTPPMAAMLAARDELASATPCTAVRECHDREVCERGRCLTPPKVKAERDAF